MTSFSKTLRESLSSRSNQIDRKNEFKTDTKVRSSEGNKKRTDRTCPRKRSTGSPRWIWGNNINTKAQRLLHNVPVIFHLNTAAVPGYPGGCRLTMR